VAPGRVHDVHVGVRGRFEALTGDRDRIVVVGVAVEVDLGALAHLLGLVVRARPEGVRLDDGGAGPFFENHHAILAAEVVFPDPWRPASRIVWFSKGSSVESPTSSTISS